MNFEKIHIQSAQVGDRLYSTTGAALGVVVQVMATILYCADELGNEAGYSIRHDTEVCRESQP